MADKIFYCGAKWVKSFFLNLGIFPWSSRRIIERVYNVIVRCNKCHATAYQMA